MPIKVQSLFYCLFYFLFIQLCVYAQDLPKYTIDTIGRYTPNYRPRGVCVLEMAYASDKILNSEDWKYKTDVKHIKGIKLIFSAYPKNKSSWKTHYDTLLSRRIRTLQKLTHIDVHTIKWKIILQNDCNTAEEAKNMFHGAEIRYAPVVPPNVINDFNELYKMVMYDRRDGSSEVIQIFSKAKLEQYPFGKGLDSKYVQIRRTNYSVVQTPCPK